MNAQITGTPLECGARAWEQFIVPILNATKNKSEVEIKQFYVGVLASAFGAMMADFGHHEADEIVRAVIDSISDKVREKCQATH
ncbi:hypothetical protein GXC69_10905 [Candidatus Macondimonas diazotrophica]|nr:hypothetical protein [Candidatus Macondimonas diazotrophica]